MESSISISFAALARIIIDDKFLLIKNKGFYTPIGGALKFDMNHISFLNDKKCTLTNGDDLRLIIPETEWSNLKKWFNMFCWRETTVYREVIEELQPLLKNDISNLKEVFIRNEYIEKDFGLSKKDTLYKNRIFQIHDVFISKESIDEIKDILNQKDLILATKEEIINQQNNISIHSKYLL